jgi:hypothetical protein
MKVTALFHGILADWVGTPSARFELPDDATYADLMKEIDHRYRRNMPDQLWDGEKNTFHRKVRPFRKGKAIDKTDFQLVEGEALTFFLMMAGG